MPDFHQQASDFSLAYRVEEFCERVKKLLHSGTTRLPSTDLGFLSALWGKGIFARGKKNFLHIGNTRLPSTDLGLFLS